ncbi:MAG: hypothetical protein J6X66_08170 [Lachnospiraceae bacterium]|nr:hypothetical protein [Lachnospiraceae bacterium]
MSSAREAGRRLLKKISQEERLRLSIFCSIWLTFFTRLIIVRRISPSGAAYFLSSADILVFFLVLIPVGASEAVHDLIQKRKKTGFMRNAGRIFATAFLHILAYVILVIILWIFNAGRFSESFLFGKAGLSTLLAMLPLFAFDAFTLILRGHSDGYYGGTHSGYIMLIRQFLAFLLVLIFAGINSSSASSVSALLRNNEVQYIYDANGILVLFMIAAFAALILYSLTVAGGHFERSLKRGKDNNRKHESPTGLFYSMTFPFAMAFMAFLSFHFVSLLVYGKTLKSAMTSLKSYIWGMYSGVLGSLCLLPYLMIFFLIYNSVRKLGYGLKGEDRGEYRIRCMNLSGESMLICFFFAVFYAVMAPSLIKGLFGIDSVLALRLVWFGMIPMILCCIAVNTSMQLMLISSFGALSIHCLLALIPALSIMIFIPGINIEGLGIYSVILASGVYYLVCVILNYLKLARELHYSFDILHVIVLPALCAVIAGIPVLLLSLLFSLFMPHILSVIICFALYFFCYLFAVCRAGLISIYSLKRIPLGRYIAKIALKLRFLEDEE